MTDPDIIRSKAGEPGSKTRGEVVLRVGFHSPKRKVAQYNPLANEKKPGTLQKRASQIPEGHSPLQKSSTQIPEDTFAYSSHLNAVEPPYNLEYLTLLNEVSVTRQACITALATNTVGLGFEIVKLQSKIEDDVLQAVSFQIRQRLNRWARKDGKTFTQLLYAAKYDEETTGNGYIEVSRDRLGRITGLYHVPAFTVRRKRDKTGFIQERPGSLMSRWANPGGTSYVEFYNFGDKYDPDTGQLRPNRDPNINEIIDFKVYAARTSFYGLPRDVAAFPTYAGDELARNQNIKYLSNAAVPEIALIFEVDMTAMDKMFGDEIIKVEIPEEVKQEIEAHFRYNLSSPLYQPGIFHLPMGVRLRIERLSQQNRDAGWAQYRLANKAESLRAFRTPAVVIGDAEAAQYATAAIQKAIYLEQVIQPEQRDDAEMLMDLLWPEITDIEGSSEDGRGVNPSWFALKFRQMSVADKAIDAQVHNIYLTTGVLDQDEVRTDIGYAARGHEKPVQGAGGGALDLAFGQTPDGGRGANGTMALTGPRRPGDVSVPVPSHLTTLGRPGYDVPGITKRDEGTGSTQIIEKADVDQVFVDEYISKIEEKHQETLTAWQRDASLAVAERAIGEESGAE